jgi:GR25 family glycosyltransferase involved in LPS biosynthesis
MEMYLVLAVLFALLILLLVIFLSIPNDPIEKLDPICFENNTFPFDVYIINLERDKERYKYVCKQLRDIGITYYKRWEATNGFSIDPKEMISHGVHELLIKQGKGLAGCAMSHILLWEHIAKYKSGWTLILEDDCHFHPDFMKLFPEYWKHIPKDAKIIFPGYGNTPRDIHHPVLNQQTLCTHGYMVNWESAEYLLKHIIPMQNKPIDVLIEEHFKYKRGSYIFNGNVNIHGIVPHHYKTKHQDQCEFCGIIYQNRKDFNRTIYEDK